MNWYFLRFTCRISTKAVGQGANNLLARAVVALVLAPLAIAIAYAGGWLWVALVTLTTIGLYVEWLTMVGASRQTRVVVAGGTMLALSGLGLAVGRIDAALLALA